ncbi:MAG: hypothetical protein ACOYN3_05110 [Acidimicrobiia bacterium]
MTITVLLILAAMWAAVLVPPILRARTASRPTDTIGTFRHSLSALGSRTGRHVRQQQSARGPIDTLARLRPATPGQSAAEVAPEPMMSPMQRRRRDIVVGLAGATGVTFQLALALGSGVAWMLWFLCTSGLGTYIYLLLRMKQARLGRERNVHYLDAHRRPQPASSLLALARRASS